MRADPSRRQGDPPDPLASRAARLASAALVGWLALRLTELTTLRFDGEAFLEVQAWLDGVWGRVAMVLVAVGALAHVVGGLAAAAFARDPEPGPPVDGSHAAGLHAEPPGSPGDPLPRITAAAVTWFVTLAVALPVAALLLWPWWEQRA